MNGAILQLRGEVQNPRIRWAAFRGPPRSVCLEVVWVSPKWHRVDHGAEREDQKMKARDNQEDTSKENKRGSGRQRKIHTLY